MIHLTAPGGALELRHISADWLRLTVARSVTLDVVAVDAHAAVTLWASRAWLEVSVAGGPYLAVGATRGTAASLGAFTAGQRKVIILRLTVPALTSIRREIINLNIGIGT